MRENLRGLRRRLGTEKEMVGIKITHLFLFSILLFCNCFIPSTYQTATILDMYQADCTPIINLQYAGWERLGNGHWLLNGGTRFQYGMTKNLNVGATFLLRYNLPEYSFQQDFRSYAEINFKFPVIKRNRFAVDLPLGVDWSYFEKETGIVLSPTFLFTYPLTERLSFSPSLRISGYCIIFGYYPGCIGLVTPFINAGFGIKSRDKRFEIRPSAGIAIGEGIAGISGGIGLIF
jgi:hypothetical protein